MTTHLKLVALTILIFASTLSAQGAGPTSSTLSARLDGVQGCLAVTLTVTQQQTNGTTNTNLYYRIRRCPEGSQTPTMDVASGSGPIPNAHYTLQGQTAHLVTVPPPGSLGQQGPIDVTWRSTATTVNTFSGTWLEKSVAGTRKTVESQEFTSATADGTIVGQAVSVTDAAAGLSRISQTVTTGK